MALRQSVLPAVTYGCQTWSLNKQLRTVQRAIERKMLNLKLQDKIPCSEIRKRTKIAGSIENTLKQKWRWDGRIARKKDNRWTKRCTEWQQRRGNRSRGRPSRRWQDDKARKEGVFVGYFNVPATGQCISGTDLLRQFYVLPH